ncbi:MULTISPECIES: S41 family peptidase [unclassified Cupriavidus]|uniref:S41 family peptidase n=1 Tax=unclassified Cupriavidus TaxID=2640874 RepID=UPI00313D9964
MTRRRLIASAAPVAFAFALAPVAAIAQIQTQAGPLPPETLRAFVDTVGTLGRSYVKPVSAEELLQAAIRGMVREIDPEGGDVLIPSEMEATPSATNTIGGVGLEMVARDGVVMVVAPLPGSPAQAAGIHPKDVLVSIDSVAVGTRTAWAVKALRGPLGSTVEVGIRSIGVEGVRTLRIERGRIQPRSAEVSIAGDDVAVLRVPAFSGNTTATIATALSAQWQRRPFRAMVIDLRHNAGGLLEASVGVASLFLPPNAMVAETEGRLASVNNVYLADVTRYGGTGPIPDIPAAFREMPIVVLVDEGTASGAEILASALRDNRRARIVGHTTFGRASIQTIQRVGPGLAIRFTAAQWYPPSRRNVDKVGVSPDVVTRGKDEKSEMDAAVAEARRMLVAK